ncbi:Lethal(2)neighbour of Tid protein, putative, partial [Ixodes scapularis]
MAPPRNNVRRSHHPKKGLFFSKHLRATYTNIMNDLRNFSPQKFINDPNVLYLAIPFLLIMEFVLNIVVIDKVPYTEIDWKAYMQEVEGVLNGTFNYAELKGDTGPLVYPAGFVYIFAALYYVTGQGVNIKLAQYIFSGLYLFTLCLVFSLYNKTRKVPPYVLVLMCCTSYRIHSIYVLRLFNDPVAMALLYAALVFFVRCRWLVGCVLYRAKTTMGGLMKNSRFVKSLNRRDVSSVGHAALTKMFPPSRPSQVGLGLPFLLSHPVSYLKGAFDLGRIFLFEWTVNWRFLPEEVFVDRRFHLALLALHLVAIACFLPKWINMYSKSLFNILCSDVRLLVDILLPLFTCNFLGMVFSRSLHYQFYVWYYHSLPYLLWSTNLAPITKLFLWGLIELSWNTFPSTNWSSGLLHCSHLLLMVNLWRHWPREPSIPIKTK